VTYEQLAADPACEARRVLAFIEVDVPAGLVIAPVTERQGDAINEDWISRYRALTNPS
jgi:LPS sulfotransferase NodH